MTSDIRFVYCELDDRLSVFLEERAYHLQMVEPHLGLHKSVESEELVGYTLFDYSEFANDERDSLTLTSFLRQCSSGKAGEGASLITAIGDMELPTINNGEIVSLGASHQATA